MKLFSILINNIPVALAVCFHRQEVWQSYIIDGDNTTKGEKYNPVYY